MSGRDKVRWRVSPFGLVQYAFCPSRTAWSRHAHPEQGAYPETSGATSWWDTSDGARMLVTMDERMDESPVDIVRVLSHEAFHVACRLLDAMGEDEPGEETLAYLVGDIAGQLFEDYAAYRSPLAKKRRGQR